MRWQYLSYIPILLLAMICLSFGEISSTSDSMKKVSDQPTTVNLGKGMVSRRNENLTTSSLYMEGGTLNKTLINKTTTSLPNITTVIETKIPKSNATLPVLPVDGGGAMTDLWPESSNDKNSSIKARKGVSPNIEDTNSTPISCECCVKNITAEQLKNCTCCQLELKPSSTSSLVTKQVEIKSSDVNVTKTTAITEATSAPTMAPSPVPHHHKPNVTSDVPEQQVPAKQEDYVIPVVGIIFAIPLIIILGALVYKKGADLWERRHYRRMDFLIDGIYNQ